MFSVEVILTTPSVQATFAARKMARAPVSDSLITTPDSRH
jgi:hypothetical protein